MKYTLIPTYRFIENMVYGDAYGNVYRYDASANAYVFFASYLKANIDDDDDDDAKSAKASKVEMSAFIKTVEEN